MSPALNRGNFGHLDDQQYRELEIQTCITLANGIDPRIQMNMPTRDLWLKVLHGREFAAIHAAIELYYERPAPPNRDRPTIDAPMIRKIIREETERAQAVQSAHKALPPARNPSSFRARNPEEWDRLMAKGRDDRRAELERRGIGLTQFQIDGDKPNNYQLPA